MIPRLVAVPGSVPVIAPKKGPARRPAPATSAVGSGPEPRAGFPFTPPSNVARVGPYGRLPQPANGIRKYQAAGTGGVVGNLMARLGYVPASSLSGLTSQAAALTSQAAANRATIAGLQSQVSQAGATNAALQAQLNQATAQIASLSSSVRSLQAQLASLNASIAQVQSQVASLEGQYGVLESQIQGDQTNLSALQTKLSGLTTTLSELNASLTTWKGTVAADLTTISSLTSTLGGLKGQVGAYSVLNAGPAGSPSAGNNISQDPSFDGAYSGFAPYSVGFAANFSSLGTTTTTDAARRFSTGYAPGQFLARALGYVPQAGATQEGTEVAGLQSEVAAQGAQILSLQSQLASAQGQTQSIRSQLTAASATVSSLTSQASSLNSQVSSANTSLANLRSQAAGLSSDVSQANTALAALTSRISSVTAQIGVLTATAGPGGGPPPPGSIAYVQSQVNGLEAQHSSNLASINGLNDRVGEYQGYLRTLQAGGLPVSFSWSFGDGTVSDDSSPSHDWASPGAYTVSVTMSVTRPDGQVVTRSWTLGQWLIGDWPTSLSGSGGGGAYSGTIYFALRDSGGNPVANCRVESTQKNALGITIGVYVAVTNAAGQVSYNYNTPGTLSARCLRNPTLTAQQGGSTY